MSTLFVGLSTLDIQYFVDEFPASNVKVKTNKPELFVGGPSTNAAVAHSFLGGKSALLSGVGNSPFQSFFKEDFEMCNIQHFDFLSNKNELPVLASVVTSVKNGDRNIFTYNPETSINGFDIDSTWEKVRPKLLFTDGFYPELAVPLCKIAKQEGIPVIFDGGSWKPHLDELLPYIDYAICSAKFYPPSCSTSNEVIEYLKSYKIENIAITNGPEAVSFYCNEEKYTIDVQPVNAVDTLGAGDFFHGAFCFYLNQKLPFADALKKASALASKTCEYAGTREWLAEIKKESLL